MIFPARKMYFNRKFLICCRYSVSFAKSILNSKNKSSSHYTQLIIRRKLGPKGGVSTLDKYTKRYPCVHFQEIIPTEQHESRNPFHLDPDLPSHSYISQADIPSHSFRFLAGNEARCRRRRLRPQNRSNPRLRNPVHVGQ